MKMRLDMMILLATVTTSWWFVLVPQLIVELVLL